MNVIETRLFIAACEHGLVSKRHRRSFIDFYTWYSNPSLFPEREKIDQFGNQIGFELWKCLAYGSMTH